jgi:hypothetical protein
MKTTLDLPDALLQQVKRRAITKGQNLDSNVAGSATATTELGNCRNL